METSALCYFLRRRRRIADDDLASRSETAIADTAPLPFQETLPADAPQVVEERLGKESNTERAQVGLEPNAHRHRHTKT
jgi:hypothetical protein